jgi:hypothetical protein
MLVGLIFANVTLASNLSSAQPQKLGNVVASVEPGFLPQWGRHQKVSTAGHVTDVNSAGQEALR